MPKPDHDADFKRLAALAEQAAGETPLRAPAQLKSNIYSALIRSQEQAGPLRPLPETKADGRALCVFEETVRVTAGRSRMQSFQCCRLCHARVLAERLERAPIWWPNCPYSQFQSE